MVQLTARRLHQWSALVLTPQESNLPRNNQCPPLDDTQADVIVIVEPLTPVGNAEAVRPGIVPPPKAELAPDVLCAPFADG